MLIIFFSFFWPHGVEGGVTSVVEGEQEDSISGGGCVRESVPPTIESKDSILQDNEGDDEKIALLSVEVSLRIGNVTCSSDLDNFCIGVVLFFGFPVHLGTNSIRQILKLFSRCNFLFFSVISKSTIRRLFMSL